MHGCSVPPVPASELAYLLLRKVRSGYLLDCPKLGATHALMLAPTHPAVLRLQFPG